MSWSRTAALAVLSLSLPPNTQIPPEDPIPRVTERLEGAYASSWTPMSARSTAVRVRLNATGAKTHANWVLFRLPFDSTQKDRIRHVKLTPSATVDTDVGAFRVGSVCVPTPTSGSVEQWTSYTIGGFYPTERMRVHIAPPTDDPTILAVNVPTRVANYVACNGEDAALRDPERWSLEVTWEQR